MYTYAYLDDRIVTAHPSEEPMSRLSREKKREQKHAGRTAAVTAPLDVHVREGGTATIGGVPVVAHDGEEIQRAVLSHLHRIALATGHPVRAVIHDERIGYVVALRVDPDGSSHFTADPLRTPVPSAEPVSAAVPTDRPAPAGAPVPVDRGTATGPRAPFVDGQTAQEGRDKATHLLRQVPEPVGESAPTFTLRAVSQPEREQETEREPGRAPVRAGGTPAPGTVTAPTGVFGPPPTMDEQPNTDTTHAPAPASAPTYTPTPTPIPTSVAVDPPVPSPTSAPGPVDTPAPISASVPIPLPLPLPAPASAPSQGPVPVTGPALTPLLPEGLISDSAFDPDPGFKPTPARGFDAVAEAVLGDDPRTLHGEGGARALLAEPIARVNEAVRAGRTDAAAELAERTVLEASGTLGPEHPEVLRLRELTAYIAYLAGDPLRSFHVSLDLARIHRRTRDAEAAYGDIQSAAAAWRAVRDPFQGLNLGTELLGLWTELTTEDGPAADDVEELESARARMLRLAERARKAGA